MNILFVVEGYYPSFGGAEKQVRLLTSHMKNKKHWGVEVVAPRLDQSRPATETLDGVAITRINYPRIKILGTIIMLFRLLWFVFRRRHQFTAIHIHMVKFMAVALAATRHWHGLPIVAKLSGAWEFDGGLFDLRKKSRISNRLLVKLLSRIDHYQAISEFTVQRLRAMGIPESRIERLPNAIDTDYYQANAARIPGAFHGVYTGRLRKVKGVDILVNAWRKLVADHPEATLFIVGDGEERVALERIVMANNLQENVRFVGEVDTVLPYLQDADVYVQPSRNEGLPNSVLEAMSCELPIVASRVSGNEDLVKEGINGYLVDPENSGALAEKLLLLASKPELRKEMGSKSRQIIINNFSLPVVVSSLNKLYHVSK